MGYGPKVTRLSYLALLCAATVGGCAAVLGADFDRKLAESTDAARAADDSNRPDVSTPERADASDARTGDARDASETAPPPPPAECGDMRGLQAGAPWPTEGYCNTRVGRSGAPSLTNPKIAWRYTLPGPTASFLSSGVIAADGTTYLFGFDPPDASGYAYSLVAVSKDGAEVFRKPINGIVAARSSPTIGADGTIYFCSSGSLSAWTPAGVVKWSVSLGDAVFRPDSTPTVLADGTIVVVGGAKVLAFRADGSARWEYPAEGYSFVGTVAVTVSGLLAVGEMPPLGQLDGALHILSPEGIRRVKLTVYGTPTTTPIVVGGSKVAVATDLSQYYVFTESGVLDTAKAGVSVTEPHPTVVYSAPRAWFAGRRSAPVTLDLSSGAVAKQATVGGLTTGFAAAKDGTLVVGVRVGGRSVVRGLSADGATQRWSIDVENSPDVLLSPALAADGTVLLPWGKTLYAIRD